MDNISRQQKSNLSENETLPEDNSINDRQIKSSDEHIEENEPSFHSQKDSLKSNLSKLEKSSQSPINKQNINSFYLGSIIASYSVIILVTAIVFGIFIIRFGSVFSLFSSMSEKQMQLVNNPTSLFNPWKKSMEEIKAKFYNQELDSWNDISSAINEIISRNPKVPQIILLFANETSTMDCLATDLADISSTVLHVDSPLYLNPENFGDDAGEIIDELNKHSPAKKVVVCIHTFQI